jgi:hypothetical protein
MRLAIVLGLVALAPVCAGRQSKPAEQAPLPADVRPVALPMQTATSSVVLIGYVNSVFKGDDWSLPPPRVGDELLQLHTRLTKIQGRIQPEGMPLFAKWRVLEVIQHSRYDISHEHGGFVVWQVAARREAEIADMMPKAY